MPSPHEPNSPPCIVGNTLITLRKGNACENATDLAHHAEEIATVSLSTDYNDNVSIHVPKLVLAMYANNARLLKLGFSMQSGICKEAK